MLIIFPNGWIYQIFIFKKVIEDVMCLTFADVLMES